VKRSPRQGLDDQRRLGEIPTASVRIPANGDYEAGLAFGQHALAISMTLGDVRLQFNTNLHLALLTTRWVIIIGRACLRTTWCPRGMLSPRRVGRVGIIRCLRAWLSSVAELGAFAEGSPTVKKDRMLRRPIIHSAVRSRMACRPLYLRQATSQGIIMLERGVELCQCGRFSFVSLRCFAIGVAYALSGRVAEACCCWSRPHP